MKRHASRMLLGMLLSGFVAACAGPHTTDNLSTYARVRPPSYFGHGPDDPFWWSGTVQIGKLHDHGNFGDKRTVAILDSGYRKASKAVADGRIAKSGVELCSGNETDDFDDINGHGTAMAGITVGQDKGSNQTTDGVASKAMLLPVKVVCGVSTNESVIRGVQIALDNKVDVILLALGAWPSDIDASSKQDVHQRLLSKVRQSDAQNTLFVVASVWDDATVYKRPDWTKEDNVLLAAAMTLDSATEVTDGNQTGDLWAPGRNVGTASNEEDPQKPGTYPQFSMHGTSAAAAILAGCAAAIKNTSETGAALKGRLKNNFYRKMPGGQPRLDCSKGL